MEKSIKGIIDIEQEANNIVAQGRLEAEKYRAKALEEVQSMRERIEAMADQKIAQLESGNRIIAEKRIAEINEQTAIKMRALEDTVEKNRALWENRIYNKILRR